MRARSTSDQPVYRPTDRTEIPEARPHAEAPQPFEVAPTCSLREDIGLLYTAAPGHRRDRVAKLRALHLM